jgi:V/A-type H+/Na+-transporting ATPase subunit C
LAQTTLYSGVLAKIGAERSQLINEIKFRTLTETKSLTELALQLREGSYQQQIAKLSPPLTSKKLERIFNENLIETYIKMIRNAPKNISAFLRLFLLRVEVENIKLLIKVANVNLSSEQKLDRIYFLAETYLKRRDTLEEAAKAPDLRRTVGSLKSTEYGLALKEGMVSYEEDGSTACFDVLLDKHFYERLFDVYQNLPRNEKSHAYPYVSLENDGFVLLTLLRGKNLHYDPNWLRLAVPTKKFNLPDQTVEAIVVAEDFDSALKITLESHYAHFFAKGSPEETLANAAKAFNRALFLHAKESRFTEIFNIGAVLAFLTQKQTEVRNLTAVSLGVEAGLKPEDIQQKLLL